MGDSNRIVYLSGSLQIARDFTVLKIVNFNILEHFFDFFRRQLLDDDKREVRLLQELLLEDGEMHGTGRERKFRWKNAG